jgi:leukotriene-A4 hydrolase
MIKNLLVILATTMMVAASNSIDPSSYANIDEIRAWHMELELFVNFAQRNFNGRVTY